MFFSSKPKIRIEPTLTLSPVRKSIAFIDGDQDAIKAVAAYEAHLKGKISEVYFITVMSIPNRIKKLVSENFIVTQLEGYTPGKEATDKYIIAAIQKAVFDGYNDITIVSSDYDFVDIFKMTAQLVDMSRIKFTLVVPKAEGRLKKCSVVGLNIIKM